MLNLIAITGKAGVGKTTVAEEFARIASRFTVIHRDSLAVPIKDFLSSLGIKKGDPNFREMAQSLSCLRNIDRDVYSKGLISGLPNPLGHYFCVVDDVRFPDEVDYLRNHSFNSLFVKLERNFSSKLSPFEQMHVSESHVNKLAVDFTIDNNRSVHEAANALWILANHWFGFFPHKFYVAGPLTTGDRKNNLTHAVEAATMLRKAGHKVYIPHAQDFAVFGDSPARPGDDNYESGFREGTDFLKYWATGVYRIPGISWGTEEELRYAREFNLPIFTNEAQLTGNEDNPRSGLEDCVFEGNITLPSLKD